MPTERQERLKPFFRFRATLCSRESWGEAVGREGSRRPTEHGGGGGGAGDGDGDGGSGGCGGSGVVQGGGRYPVRLSGDFCVAFQLELKFPPWPLGVPGCVSRVNFNYSTSHQCWSGKKKEELIWGEKVPLLRKPDRVCQTPPASALCGRAPLSHRDHPSERVGPSVGLQSPYVCGPASPH